MTVNCGPRAEQKPRSAQRTLLPKKEVTYLEKRSVGGGAEEWTAVAHFIQRDAAGFRSSGPASHSRTQRAAETG